MPNMPIRIGKPRALNRMVEELNSTEYVTAVGLLLYEAGEYTQYELDRTKKMLHSKDYVPKESITDINLINRNPKPKIAVSQPSFEEKSTNDLFTDLTNEPVTNNNNPVQTFMDWAKKIF
jgi:cell division protein FtsA